MEETENPTESIQEDLHHHAEHSGDRWISQVALSSAILAVFAAVTALLSGHHANEAMVEQIHASDQWAYYQAKGIKSSILSLKMELLKNGAAADQEKMQQYKKDQEEISKLAKEKEDDASAHFTRHMIFARGVTLFQISIAIAAISALIRRRKFWYVALCFGVVGLGFLCQGLLT